MDNEKAIVFHYYLIDLINYLQINILYGFKTFFPFLFCKCYTFLYVLSMFITVFLCLFSIIIVSLTFLLCQILVLKKKRDSKLIFKDVRCTYFSAKSSVDWYSNGWLAPQQCAAGNTASAVRVCSADCQVITPFWSCLIIRTWGSASSGWA